MKKVVQYHVPMITAHDTLKQGDNKLEARLAYRIQLCMYKKRNYISYTCILEHICEGKYCVQVKIDLYKFEKIEKFVFELLYLAIGLVVTFILSAIIVYLIQKIKELFFKGIKLLKQ